MFALLFVFTAFFIQAQTSPSTNSVQSVQTDGSFGPTLIICSNKSDAYEKSVTQHFGQKWNVNSDNNANPNIYPIGDLGYRLVRVGGTAPYVPTTGNYQALPHYQYLDQAINNYLGWNFQRIIILEGDYEVNDVIVIDKLNGTETGKGRITIEGEGFGTRIKNASTYTSGNIFEVRSFYNTIKNLSIISNNTNTCLAVTSVGTNGVLATVDPKHNVFENLYIGVNTMVSNDNPANVNSNLGAVTGEAVPANMRIGISINSSNKQVGFNIFKNIVFNSVDKGVELQGSLRLHDNVFENFTFENTIVGVDFVAGVNTVDNIFDHLSIQTDSYSKNLVRNIAGRHNSFNALNHNDWIGIGGQTNHSFVSIASTAEHTTISNSEIGRGTVYYLKDGVNPSNPDAALVPSKYTQLINNYGGNSDVTYRIGNNTNATDAGAASKVEVLGEFISSHDGNNQIFAKNGRTIIGNISPTLLSEINTQDPNTDYKLIVNGKVRVRSEVYVKQGGLTWPDYVFAKDYKLMPLQQVEQHIQEKGYLPNMPSAAEVEKDGIAVGNIIKLQQEKIEELTLYLIEMKKQNDDLQNRMKALENNQKK
jgi:hypothetical protein